MVQHNIEIFWRIKRVITLEFTHYSQAFVIYIITKKKTLTTMEHSKYVFEIVFSTLGALGLTRNICIKSSVRVHFKKLIQLINVFYLGEYNGITSVRIGMDSVNEFLNSRGTGRRINIA